MLGETRQAPPTPGEDGREGKTTCRALSTLEGVPLSTADFTFISPQHSPFPHQGLGQMDTGARRGALHRSAQTRGPKQAGKMWAQLAFWRSGGRSSGWEARQGRGVESAMPRALCSQHSGYRLPESSQPHEPAFIMPISQRRKPRLRRAKTRCRSIGVRSLRLTTLEGEARL